MHKCAIAIASLMVAGCAMVGPNYRQPVVDIPQEWGTAGHDMTDASWSIFGDPVLLELLAEAERNNQDLALAVARVDEARALVGRSNADLFPQSV